MINDDWWINILFNSDTITLANESPMDQMKNTSIGVSRKLKGLVDVSSMKTEDMRGKTRLDVKTTLQTATETLSEWSVILVYSLQSWLHWDNFEHTISYERKLSHRRYVTVDSCPDKWDNLMCMQFEKSMVFTWNGSMVISVCWKCEKRRHYKSVRFGAFSFGEKIKLMK